MSDGVDDDLLVQSEAKADLCMSSASGAPRLQYDIGVI